MPVLDLSPLRRLARGARGLPAVVMRQRPERAALLRAAQPLVAATLLLFGYLFRAPGTAHTDYYHAYSFQSLNYSDIIWLYLRDHLARQPRPYLDFPLEYPPLTGGLSYLLSFAPDLHTYFALATLVLAVCGLAAVAALGGLVGARPWYLAAAPALLLYGGLNWDLAAIGMTALALLSYARGRDGWGTLALIAAVWLKLFPVVFLPAIVIARLCEGRWRAALSIGARFALGSAAINLPLALANRAGWSYFFTYNDDRRAEPSLWTLFPRLTIDQINSASLALLAFGALICGVLALRTRQPSAPAVGALLLLWWFFVNKIYSPQYALWVFLALALLGLPRGLWRGFVLFDLVYYYASFQILFTSLQHADALVEWQTRYLVQPLVVVRLALLGACVVVGVARLWSQGEPLMVHPWLAERVRHRPSRSTASGRASAALPRSRRRSA